MSMFDGAICVDSFGQVEGSDGPHYWLAAVSNPKPSFTRAEAAAQITRYNLKWYADLDGITWVTFGFAAESPVLGGRFNTQLSFSRFDETQINFATQLLNALSDVANIKFDRVGTGVSGETAYTNSATILFSNYYDDYYGFFGFGEFPGDSDPRSNTGNVYLNKFTIDDNSMKYLSGYSHDFLHEVGHAIGLSHPGDYLNGLYDDSAEYIEDSNQYTIMSYFGSQFTGASFGLYSSTPLIDDIGALQRLYGANMTTRTGDTVYGFNSTADRDWFSASKDGIARPVIFCVWDAGGNDTLDFSGYSDIQLIDLNAERFSNVGGYIGNVSIATNVVIENAIGGSGDDSLIGNSADNRLEGRAGNDSLSGGAGNDTLVGGVGDDRLDGGAGLDIASYAEVKSDLTLDLTLSTAQSMGSAGRDTLISIEGIIGGSGNDSLKGGAEDNYYEGGAGNDRLDGGDGLDVASFAGLTRTLDIDLSTFSGTITTDLGTDTLISIEGIVGGAANDSLKGDGGANYLDGGAGDDSLVGRGGDDLYVVDSGNDKVIETANEGTDLVKALISYGLAANVENLTLLGNAAIDGTGNSLDNILTGNGAANRLDGGAGNDRLIGGGGDDVYLLDSSGDVVVENANEGADTILAGFSYSLGTNLENLTLTGTGAIDGTGNGLDNLLTGNSGNNQLFGGAGNDILIGGAGNDRLDGGDGFDLASYDDLTIALEVDLNNSAGTVISASGTDTLVSIEGIVGGSGNDTLKGNGADNQLGGGSGDDTLMGLAGNDILRGGAGLDQIDGGAGDDTLYGEAGNDNLSGDAGDDVIDGGVGDDVLSGGDGVDKLVGGVGNDRLLGGAGSDTLQGGDGNDTLSGDDGNDLLSGGAGADIVDGGSGNNELYGGDGNDILRAGDVGDRIYGDAGDDTITGGAGFDQLYGGSGNDTINGGAGTDLLFGGAGDDILNGGDGFDYVRYSYSYQNLTVDLRIKAAQDTGEGLDKIISIEGIQGGSGDDLLIGDDSRNEINGGWGNDKLYGYDGYDALQGDLGDDILNGGAGNDTLDGGAGLDLASYAEVTTDLNFDLNLKTPQKMGSAGSDTLISIEGLIGGSGNDTLKGDGGANILDGGSGNDALFGGVGDDILIGGAGSNRLEGGDGLDVASYASLTSALEIDLSNFSGTVTTALGKDTLISIEGLIGGAGNDTLKAGATATYLDGGAGNDFLGGSAYADTLIGGAGDDGIAAGADNDSLDGGAGDDTLLGQAGDDIIGGGAGRDFIDGGDGSDRLNGGEGNDWFNGGNGDDIINADAGNDSVYGDAGNDTIDGAHGNDEIYGGDGNDTVTGGLGDDRISGGVGNDLLYGGDGNDTISGNDGDDRIIGGDGDDNLYGFTGYDQIIGGNGNDTLLGMEGDDTLDGQLGNDYLVGGSGNDNLWGGADNDSMDGGDGNDVLNGETGDDGLTGGAGDDALFGGAGNDQLWAGDGNDGLDGNDGNDLIIGGMGQDTLAGGAGADAFFFMAANESTAAARDRITDFNWADGDYIDLSRIDANTTVAGDQAFSFVNSFSKQAGQATLTYDAASNTSTFSADVDGDGIADFVLQVNGQQNTGQGWVL